jgi:hypothetical protein
LSLSPDQQEKGCDRRSYNHCPVSLYVDFRLAEGGNFVKNAQEEQFLKFNRQ